MKTTGQAQPQASSESTGGRSSARADTLDVVLLILTMVVLTGAAAGIVIGFPQALEIVAAQASAAAVADVTAPERHAQAAGEDEEEVKEPFFGDDIRREGVMYASAAAMAAPAGRSEPQQSGRSRE
jgi:hypothetical protein